MALDDFKSLIEGEDFWYDLEDNPNFTIVEQEDWTQDGKYQSRTTIVKFKDTYYAVHEYRTGSYWYYEEPQVCEVAQKVEVKEVLTWVPVPVKA